MAEITAVTFDLWQTLLLDNRELGRARAQVRLEGTQEALGRAGMFYDLEHIQEAYRACYRECRRIRDQNLDVNFRDQVEIFINNIDGGMVDRLDEETIQEIIRVYADSFFVHPPVPHSAAQNSNPPSITLSAPLRVSASLSLPNPLTLSTAVLRFPYLASAIAEARLPRTPLDLSPVYE